MAISTVFTQGKAIPYLGGLGSECGSWLESGWPADQVMMGLAFFQPF